MILLSFILLLIPIWSLALTTYQEGTGFYFPPIPNALGMLLIAALLSIFILRQLPERGKALLSPAGLCSMGILLLPFVCSQFFGFSALLSYGCVPLALFVFAGFAYEHNKSSLSCYASAFIYSCLWFFFIYSLLFANPYFDSWQIYSLAESFTKDFYYMDFIRQSFIDSHYAIGFPYAYPFLVFIADTLTGYGIHSYLLVNFSALLLTIYLIKKICILLHKQNTWPFAALLIIIFQFSTQELQGGGSTPIISTIYFALFYILLIYRYDFSQLLKFRNAMTIGAILGFASMVRFDFIPFAAIAIFIYTGFAIKNKKWGSAITLLGLYSLVLAPWIIYSWTHFGSLFITDNSRRIINIPDTTLHSYYSQENPAMTIWSHPWIWVMNMVRVFIRMIQEFISYNLNTAYISILLTLAISKIETKDKMELIRQPAFSSFLIIFICAAGTLFALFATHYENNTRYYLPLLSFLILSSLLYIDIKKRILISILISISLIPVSYNIVRNIYRSHPISSDGFTGQRNKIQTFSDNQLAIKTYIQNCSSDARLVSPHSQNYPKFAAKAGIPIMILPKNIDADIELFMHFCKDFKLTYLYSPIHKELINAGLKNEILERTKIEHLYTINQNRIHRHNNISAPIQIESAIFSAK